MSTFAEKVIFFLRDLEYRGSLPQGISVMNPYRENPPVMQVISRFYNKFYNDRNSRHLILGINPGRFGAGVTGIPFTDTRRLYKKCGLSIPGLTTFETSSVFVYEMIDAYGGTEKFYLDFFISAVSPLGFTYLTSQGKEINYNYYDSKKLTEAVYKFIIDNLNKQLQFGIERDICYCLGTGKNYKFLSGLNDEMRLFKNIIPLEHPRYIMQYKSKQKAAYIGKYLEAFHRI